MAQVVDGLTPQRRHYLANKEKCDKRTKDWWIRHPNYANEYYAANIDKKREYWKKRKDKTAIYLKTKREFAIKILEQHFGELKCARCGYKNFTALDGHHLNPSQKEHSRDTLCHWIQVKSTLKVKLESSELVLLCKNCHAELHAGEWFIEELKGGNNGTYFA